jgi:hypothetical protein
MYVVVRRRWKGMQKSNTLGYVEKRNKVAYANSKSEKPKEKEK